MRNVAIWFVKAKCFVGNVIPSEEIGLTLSHKTFVCTYLKIQYS